MSIDAIQQAAREQMERHRKIDGNLNHWCEHCGSEWPCPDRVAAERIVHEADALAATHEKIREHLRKIALDCDPWWTRQSAEDAEAILGLLGGHDE